MKVANGPRACRSKEGSSDYRYFPEPDLPPIEVSVEQKDRLAGRVARTPPPKSAPANEEEFGLSAYRCLRVLADERSITEYFEATVGTGADPKLAANWISPRILPLISMRKS